MQSLGCVLAATVRGARGSRVPLIIGLSCTRRSRRRRATKPHFHAPEWVARPMTTDKDEVPSSSPAPAHSALRTHLVPVVAVPPLGGPGPRWSTARARPCAGLAR
jgi:hypothetical protein